MNNKDKKGLRIICYIVTFFLGCGVMYLITLAFPIKVTENVTKLEKDVTVTDTGISDAVEKIYDAVVVVSTYKDNSYVGSGTGFVFKKDDNKYYILTNHHVIEKGNKVNVTFTDGEILETSIIGSNQYADIAVLTIDSKKELVIAEIGKSEDSKVGDTSFAVGAPLGSTYSWTVTRGIISGKERMVEVEDYVMKVLQTDAAINSGNSGGPLCNSNGEVIGITSLKLVSDGIEGMGFAIPIEDAIETANTIIKGETITYPYLGIGYIDITSAFSSYQGYYRFYELIKESGLSEGVIITEIEKNSSADKAGLKVNDIIVSFNGEKVPSMAYLKYYLYQYNVGDKVKLEVYRNGKKTEVNVTLGSNKQTT